MSQFLGDVGVAAVKPQHPYETWALDLAETREVTRDGHDDFLASLPLQRFTGMLRLLGREALVDFFSPDVDPATMSGTACGNGVRLALSSLVVPTVLLSTRLNGKAPKASGTGLRAPTMRSVGGRERPRPSEWV